MAECNYKEVPIITEGVIQDRNTGKKPFLKQLLICSGVWTSMFLFGLIFGAPTTIIPQMRKEANNTNVITDEMASWLSSCSMFSGFPFLIIVSVSTRFFGRKIPYVISTINTLVALIILHRSSNATGFLVSQIMQGLFAATQLVMSVLTLTEYTSPKYRGLFLTIKIAMFYWGIFISNIIGTFCHWKIIPLLGIACVVCILAAVLMWPESPFWLASKGRFEECAASHRLLKGCDEESEKELEALLHSHKEYIASCAGVKLSAKEHVTNFFKTISSKEFYKPTFLSAVTGALTIFSGKQVCVVYAIDIVKKITNSESTAYSAMLILDGVTIISMYIGCVLSKFVKQRSLLLVSAAVGIAFLFIVSLYTYLTSIHVIIENVYVSVALLIAFSCAVSCGVLILGASVYAELIPVRSRSLSVMIIICTMKIIMFIVVKTAPSLFKTLGIHGLFLFFGTCSLVILIILYKYLPETKDKTIQEISDMVMNIELKKSEDSKLLRIN